MEHGILRNDLETVAFTTATPFSEDGDEVLYREVKANASYLEEAGANVLVPCGNTGEYYSLSEAERVGVVEATVEAVSDDVRVVAGAGGSTKDAKQLIQQYEAAGADAAMIMQPHHTYVHRQGLLRYYRELASSTDLGIVIYCRGHEVPTDVLATLSTVENVVAIKYAINDIGGFSEAVSLADGDVTWLNGIAERFAPAFTVAGADGFTTGIGGFAPRPVLALAEALDDGDWERARRLQELFRPFENLRSESGPDNDAPAANSVPAVKYGLELAGQYGGPVREPLVELDDVTKDRAREQYEQISSTEY